MRIGTVVGPIRGLFWLDAHTSTLVLRPGTSGISAELTVKVAPEEMAALLEGMLPEAKPIGRRRGVAQPRKHKLAAVPGGKP